MTPLIDIVLVVLIIMMVNIPIQVSTMGVKLPSNTNKPVLNQEPQADQLVLAMYEDGTYALNRRVMGEDVLAYEITRRLKPLTNKIVFIDADTSILFDKVVMAMDLAREAGADKVALAKIKEGGPLQPTSVAPGSIPRGVTFGTPTVVGEITEKQAYEQFTAQGGFVQTCYFTQLSTQPDLSGRFMLEVDIGPQGEIMGHRIVGSNMEAPELELCVDTAAEGLKYAPLGEQKTARVRYPLLFSPG